MQDAVAFLSAHLVVLDPGISQLSFNALAQDLVPVGELARVSIRCSGEHDPQDLERMTLPKPEEGADTLIAPLLFPAPFASLILILLLR